jgi:hypothetical protein
MMHREYLVGALMLALLVGCGALYQMLPQWADEEEAAARNNQEQIVVELKEQSSKKDLTPKVVENARPKQKVELQLDRTKISNNGNLAGSSGARPEKQPPPGKPRTSGPEQKPEQTKKRAHLKNQTPEVPDRELDTKTTEENAPERSSVLHLPSIGEEEPPLRQNPPTSKIGLQEPEEEPPSTPAVIVAPQPPRRESVTPGAATEPELEADTKSRSLPSVATLPSGSVIEIRLAQPISSKRNQTGDVFEATLDQDLVTDREVIIPSGSRVTGKLAEVEPPGKTKGRARLTIRLEEIFRGDVRYSIRTNHITLEAESTKGKDVVKVGAATAVGAVLGAILGGKKGAAIGSASGAGAGAAGVLLTRGRHVEIPSERLFSFRLEETLEVEMQ